MPIQRNEAGAFAERYAFTDQFGAGDYPRITQALRTTGWAANVTVDQVAKAYENSFAIGVRRTSDNALVGFARAVTDYASFGYLTDLFVSPEERSAGLASAMVQELLNAPELKSVSHLTLLASKPSIEALGAFHGFQRTEWQSAWLERVLEPPG